MVTYNLFISHSWNYADQYNRIVELLRQRPNFEFRDYSVPPDDPIHNAANDAQLRVAIRNQMIPCHAIIILAGVYATYSKWINAEIDLAKDGFQNPKPIIAVRPSENTNISATVREAADRIVGWNTVSIVNAIHDLT